MFFFSFGKLNQFFMKKLFLILLLGVFALPGFSQTVNGEQLSEIESPYLLLIGTQKFIGPTVTIEVDFGQFGASKTFKSKNEVKILDADKRPVEFNSMVDALNFFTKYNYEFVNAYAITVGGSGLGGGNQNVYHWLLKRK
jgi:hypothetical protein